ncbi:MAG TPA: hypothetical protein VJ385_16490 [Fibrobacteria bacterium]|nr:hypothetical protein [Fibrobacteria bacterium]
MKTGFKNANWLLSGAAGLALLTACMNPMDAGDTAKNAPDETVALRADGDSAGTDKGGYHGKKDICHMPPGNPANAHTLTVGASAVPAHLAHGDKPGRCEDLKPVKPCPDRAHDGSGHKGFGLNFAAPKVLVCHIPPGNPANAHTIRVGLPALKAHLAHGDRLGACMGADPVPHDCGGGGSDDDDGTVEGGTN